MIVRPEEGERIQKRLIRIGKIFRIHAIGHDKNLHIVKKSSIRMLFVAHYLVDGFTNINAAPFELNLDERQTVYKNRNIVTILILPDDGGLVSNLKDVFCRVFFIKEPQIDFCAIIAL